MEHLLYAGIVVLPYLSQEACDVGAGIVTLLIQMKKKMLRRVEVI